MKYALQIRFEAEKGLGEETMTIVTDDGTNYDKMAREMRKVFDRGKFVKLSS